MNVVDAAKEFGLHSRFGGWRLGYLVAACVTKGKANGRPKKEAETFPGGKVSAAGFARLAGTSPARVLRYLDAWDKAAEAGHVPASVKLGLASEMDLPDDLPEWSEFYTGVSGGYNGGADRQPTPKQAKTVLDQLPPEELTAVITEAIEEMEDGEDLLLAILHKLAGSRGKTPKTKKDRKMHEMSVVLELMGVLGQIRDLAKEDSDSPLIKECKNLMRETLEILDGIEEADDPDVVEKMFSDFGDLLSSQ